MIVVAWGAAVAVRPTGVAASVVTAGAGNASDGTEGSVGVAIAVGNTTGTTVVGAVGGGAVFGVGLAIAELC